MHPVHPVHRYTVKSGPNTFQIIQDMDWWFSLLRILRPSLVSYLCSSDTSQCTSQPRCHYDVGFDPHYNCGHVKKLDFVTRQTWPYLIRFTSPTPTWSYMAFSLFSSWSLSTARYISGNTFSSYNLENIQDLSFQEIFIFFFYLQKTKKCC